jgi:DNA-binding response OmpR family regulator
MILIVDDNPESCRPLVKLLRMEGIAAFCIEDPFTALGAIVGRPPDLLVLDVVMPGLSGIELLRLIRGNLTVAQIPAIFYAAGDAEQGEAQAPGALDWVVKGETASARLTASSEPTAIDEGHARALNRLPGGRAALDRLAQRVVRVAHRVQRRTRLGKDLEVGRAVHLLRRHRQLGWRQPLHRPAQLPRLLGRAA